MTFEGNLFNLGDDNAESRITASKQLSDKLEIISVTTLGHANDQGVRVNYDLSKWISLQAETGLQGRTGFDVLYRLRFK